VAALLALTCLLAGPLLYARTALRFVKRERAAERRPVKENVSSGETVVTLVAFGLFVAGVLSLAGMAVLG
jgi:uncharacterized membrane protein YidH (DUF202 family)